MRGTREKKPFKPSKHYDNAWGKTDRAGSHVEISVGERSDGWYMSRQRHEKRPGPHPARETLHGPDKGPFTSEDEARDAAFAYMEENGGLNESGEYPY